MPDDVLDALKSLADRLAQLEKPTCPKCRQGVIVILPPETSTNKHHVAVCLNCNHSWGPANAT